MDKAIKEKIRVLALADSPTCATGFAQVARNILKVLHDSGKFEIDIVGINFDGSYYDRDKFPYRIYPAMNSLVPNPAYHDLFGRQTFLDKLGDGIYDLVWVLQDTFIIEPLGPKIMETIDALPGANKFRWIYYFPIDAIPKKSWIDNSVLLADYPVAYTKYGYDECLKIYSVDDDSLLEEKEKKENEVKFALLKGKLNVIYHGINSKQFYPLDLTDEERMKLRVKYFGEKNARKFIFMNMNRNQPRKDLFNSMRACKALLDRRRDAGKDDVYFYFHCLHKDISGLNLLEMSKQINFVQGDEFAFPNPVQFTASQGYPIEIINEIYNAVDCVFSSSLGEGFGLSVVEGMSTKKPVIMPGNTALNEIVGNNERGLLVKSGESIRDFIVLANDNDRVRPITDTEDLVKQMEWVIDNPDKVKAMVERAYKWVSELHWDKELIGKKWITLFENAYKQVINDRKIAVIEENTDFSKLKRNDMCPVCRVKFKNCVHYEKKEGIFAKKFKLRKKA